MTTILAPAPAPARPIPPVPEPPVPGPSVWSALVRALAAGCAVTAVPFGAPVFPHTVAGLLRRGSR